jgi:hypothetical protein
MVPHSFASASPRCQRPDILRFRRLIADNAGVARSTTSATRRLKRTCKSAWLSLAEAAGASRARESDGGRSERVVPGITHTALNHHGEFDMVPHPAASASHWVPYPWYHTTIVGVVPPRQRARLWDLSVSLQGALSSSPPTMPAPRVTSLAISSAPTSHPDDMSNLIILECGLDSPQLPYSLKAVRHVTLEGAHFLLEYRDGYHAIKKLGSDVREAFLFGVLTHYLINFYVDPIWPLPAGHNVSAYKELEKVRAIM